MIHQGLAKAYKISTEALKSSEAVVEKKNYKTNCQGQRI
jgi:hypothetical protein